MIVGLPGNHDLGLGSGIRLPVRKRFHAYFGWGNRIDVVGNHTFVSLDTVSLSAKGQTDPATGSQRVDDANKESWGPVENFLRLAQAEKARVVARELRVRYGKPENDLMNHDVIELEEDPRARTISIENLPGTDMPSIILTHVPLYRAPGTPCGALRERYPPSRPGNADGEPPETDDANSIPLQQGIQYQNVLTQQISNELVDLVGDVTHAFSGDDHDYCDIIHRGYTSKNGGIREVTVKSISWAMGVRKPGVVLLSLWNPVDEDGKAVGQDASKAPTIQTHLCLLPDQLSIFIRYGWLLAFTLLLLFIRACKMAFTSTSVTKEVSGHLLPLPVLSPSSKHQEAKLPRAQAHPSHVSSSSRSSQTGLAVRSSAARSRNRGLANGYGYHSPAVEDEEDEVRHEIPVDRGWNDIPLGDSSRPERRRGMGAVYDELRESVVFVALVVLGWYFWLLWNS